MNRFWNLVANSSLYAVAGGLAAGCVIGWPLIAAGFPWFFADTVRRSVLIALASWLLFLVGYEALAAAFRGRMSSRVETPLAVALSAIPFIALAGYHLNRFWGIRPRDLATSGALLRNLTLMAIATALIVIVIVMMPRWRLAFSKRIVAAVVVLLALQFATAFSPGGDEQGPNVIVLLVDALRADHLSAYGYERPTTPAIDGLAKDGVIFHQTISQSTFTKSSIASLFTGRNPYQHGVYWGSRDRGDGRILADMLGDSEATLAEVLAQHGFFTAAWVQNSHLQNGMGFGQGFISYHDNQGSIRRIHRLFRRWLSGSARKTRFFAYLHYIDLHDPYRPEPPYDGVFGKPGDPYAQIELDHWGTYLAEVRAGQEIPTPEQVEQFAALYDGQLRFVDDEIGRLLSHLEEKGLYDRSLIILTADHGDAFMEHGFLSHSTTPYEELIRVPLIIKFPNGRFGGQVITEQVRLIDVMPTIIRAVGITDLPEGISGCNLVPLAKGEESLPEECRMGVTEIAEDGGYPTISLRSPPWKYIHHETQSDELFDLQADPGERDNLINRQSEVAEQMLEKAIAIVVQRRTGIVQQELDQKSLDALRALGYLK